MDIMDAIFDRRSIRKFTDEPVADHEVETLLRAAMAAPSAGNQQPWQFVVLRGRQRLEQVAGMHPHVHMAAKAALGILVCGDTRVEKYAGYWVIDCAAAVQNLLLAAHGLGLGAVWTGIHPMQERVDAFAKFFGVPAGVIPHSFIPLGRPAEARPREDRFRPERVHQESF